MVEHRTQAYSISQDREIRAFAGQIKLRAKGDGDEATGVLEGYAAIWDEETDLGWSTESIAQGAFTESLADDDQRALVDHNTGMVIGRTSADTLTLSEDTKGLKCSITLPDTSYARDLRACVERGDITGMSVGFIIQAEERIVNEDDDMRGGDHWKVKKARLLEVSAVAFPAYEGTELSARSKNRREAQRAESEAARADARSKDVENTPEAQPEATRAETAAEQLEKAVQRAESAVARLESAVASVKAVAEAEAVDARDDAAAEKEDSKSEPEPEERQAEPEAKPEESGPAKPDLTQGCGDHATMIGRQKAHERRMRIQRLAANEYSETSEEQL